MLQLHNNQANERIKKKKKKQSSSEEGRVTFETSAIYTRNYYHFERKITSTASVI